MRAMFILMAYPIDKMITFGQVPDLTLTLKDLSTPGRKLFRVGMSAMQKNLGPTFMKTLILSM